MENNVSPLGHIFFFLEMIEKITMAFDSWDFKRKLPEMRSFWVLLGLSLVSV